MKQDRDTKIGERAKVIVSARKSMEALKKAQSAPKRSMPKEPTTGGADTVPLTLERKEFLKEMAKRNAEPGYKKGGKMASCGMKKGGKVKAKAKAKAKANPFAATKFGAAMMKKSKDTEGRAMKKFAKGGSIDGCAVKGKTKARMAMGGMAGYKRGGKTC